MTMRNFRVLLTAILLIGAVCQSGVAQTRDQVVPRIIDALGGLNRIQSIKAERISGTISFGPGNPGKLLVELQVPGKIHEELGIQGKTLVRGYDGIIGWQIDPFTDNASAKALSEADTKGISEEADIFDPVVGYPSAGTVVELVGREKVLGKDAFKFKVTRANSDVHFYYYDCESYLKVKWEAEKTIGGKDVVIESYFSDYRAVEGIRVPFLIKSDIRGTEGGQQIVVDKIDFNPVIAGNRFTMPASNKPGA